MVHQFVFWSMLSHGSWFHTREKLQDVRPADSLQVLVRLRLRVKKLLSKLV